MADPPAPVHGVDNEGSDDDDDDDEGSGVELSGSGLEEDELPDEADEQQELESEDSEDSEDEDGPAGVRLSPSEIPVSHDDDVTNSKPDLHPSPPTPYVHDAGHLLISSPNPVPPKPSEAQLTAIARDTAQSLLNHLLTTCPITKTQDTASGSGVLMTLPAPAFQLPREKRVPAPKAPTKWEKFAAKKGIGQNKRRKGKKVFDEEKGEWVERYGWKRGDRDAGGQWLVEVDEKKEKEMGKEEKGLTRAERKEMVIRGARRDRRERRALKS